MTVIIQRKDKLESFEIYDVRSIQDGYVLIGNDRYHCLTCTVFDGTQFRYHAKDFVLKKVVW